MKYTKLGIIGRFKPLHLGQQKLLERACESAEHVTIGIGSSNKYNLRNPFTFEETEQMIKRSLAFPNYSITPIPDFGDGEKWVKYLIEQFGDLDVFVTGNTYVQKLLEEHYKILDSHELIPEEDQIRLRATKVRYEIAVGDNWRNLVPEQVAEYLDTNNLIERFRKEFGEETKRIILSNPSILSDKSEGTERRHCEDE